MISKEAEELLLEILEHESDDNYNYWMERFKVLDRREDTILRGCFRELQENNLVSTKWADNIPYIIIVLKDGYLFQKHKEEQKKAEETLSMSSFEMELTDLLERAKQIKKPINCASIGTDIEEYNRPSKVWVNDFEIFSTKYLGGHSLSGRICKILEERKFDAYNELVSCLESISKDKDFISTMNKKGSETAISTQTKAEYDVFLSHANKDKLDYVNELYNVLKKLGINIFYDTEEIDWGDDWKQKILDGTEKSEFAVIVISDKFFGREWTERELTQFLNRQNSSGQKIILPLLYNTTIKSVGKRYPELASIQALDSKDKSKEEIAIILARQLIKRYKGIG